MPWADLVHVLGWLMALAVAVVAVLELVGLRLMVAYFPEGRRAWHGPAQAAALGTFGLVAHFTPF